MEEVYDDGKSVGNGAYNSTIVVENHLHKIKKSEADTDLNSTEKNAVEEDNVNEKTHIVNYDTYIDNCVDGSVAYDQLKELLICDSLYEVNVCALKLMELLSLDKMDNGATSFEAKYK